MMKTVSRDPKAENTRPMSVGRRHEQDPGRSVGRVFASVCAGALSLLMMAGCVEYATDGGASVPEEGHRTKQSIGGLAAGDVIKIIGRGRKDLEGKANIVGRSVEKAPSHAPRRRKKSYRERMIKDLRARARRNFKTVLRKEMPGEYQGTGSVFSIEL